jgi:hypothetical protein
MKLKNELQNETHILYNNVTGHLKSITYFEPLANYLAPHRTVGNYQFLNTMTSKSILSLTDLVKYGVTSS